MTVLSEVVALIVSVSRNTDVPAYYSDWFFNRLKIGYVLVPNPANSHQISKVKLSPDAVDCFVFRTKDPKPMMDKLDKLSKYNYCFQFTLNSYSADIEPNVPSKEEIVPTFRELSDRIGRERVIWRYDPIFVDEKYTAEHHIRCFRKLAEMLEGKFEQCVIGFVDLQSRNAANIRKNGIDEPGNDAVEQIAGSFSGIADEMGFVLKNCSEKYDLSKFGIERGEYIDKDLIERITGQKLNVPKGKNQSIECGCAESIDIGLNNTCLHGCKYCNANL